MQKLPYAAALALGLGLIAPSALADEVRGTRSETLIERRHEASLTVHPGWATLIVRRTVHNGGPRHDQAVFFIDVPQGAAAVGLRTLGSLDGRPHWFAGELLEAEEAAARYRELTGMGAYYPKDPALLSWRSQDRFALQVFPVPPSEPKTIEYTYMLPTEYRAGAHHVVLPDMGTETLSASLRAQPAPGSGKLLIGGSRMTSEIPVRIERGGSADIALVARHAPAIGGALAVVPFAGGRVLTRYRVEAAPKLSVVPRGARVVVVLDGSRSLDEEQRQAQVAAARAYLSHFEDAQVEVLIFDREVRARHGRFVGVGQALRDLEGFKLEGRNGSEVENALLEAEELLARQPRQHPKRILLVTDTRTKEELTPARLRGSVGRSGAIVHLALVDEGEPHLERTDDHEWTVVTRPTGGLVWQAAASVDPKDIQANRAVFEEWVRPLRIHHLSLSAPRVPDTDIEHDETLHEGEGIAHAWIADQAAPWLKIEGELWAQPIRARLDPDAEEGRRWSALVFGSPLMNELTDEEMMTLAKRGGAVSPVTSYLAIEPGVRPSTEGLDEVDAMGFGSGTGVGQGFGSGRGRLTSPDAAVAWLQSELGAHWKRCGGMRSTTLTIETTMREVVEVAREVAQERSDEAAASTCLRKAAWDLQPAALFDDFSWRRWHVKI
jgi:hypothetical protein